MAGRGSGGALAAVIVLLSWCWSGAAQPSPRCGAGDLAALTGFSAGLDAPVDGWPAVADDDEGDCCAWPGVVCGRAGVVGVVLPNRTLRGEVAASLAGLTGLRVLNLSGNALRGALPPGLLRLRRLEVLDVSSNALAGAIRLGLELDLPAVRVFNVSYNAFNGSHPVLPGAVNLTAYDASGNGFEGPVDAAAVCASSPGLRVLRLSMNRLSGDFPVGFGQCRSLLELSLDGNGITGVLPDELFAATSLRYLSLHTNSISGEIPPGLRNLTALVRLDLSFNAFSGALPEVFDALAGTLQELSAPSNLLTGGLPATLSLCVNLRVLNLRNNTLTGAIGLDFRAVNSLVYLDLGVNKFTGLIPASLPECAGMTALNLGRNLLTGEIPPWFATFPSLSFLSLTGNGFSNVTSALRILQRLPNLTSLVLTKNFRGGEAMPEDGIDGFAKIEVLVIANCELTGAIPEWLAGLRKLKVLDISWNRLAGPIPPLLGELDRLFYLDISNNSLQGEIPASLTRMPALLAGSGNGRGDDDQKVQDFPFFMRRNVSAKGRQYNQVSSFPASLVLGRNNLTGGVPAGLGALARLHIVDLSWNGFSGRIPPELSGMTSLESLDVSHNALSGDIPESLTRLSFLSHFAVAYNNLSGEIPVGGQFFTFSSADFAGNPFLCGFHVGRKCDRKIDDQATDGSTTGSNDGRRSAGVVAAICVGTALLVAVGLAATWRAWSRRRQEDNACRVAAGDDEESSDSSAARSSTLVLLFRGDEEEEQTTAVITLDEVVKATGDFDETRIVGCGGFGMVYRATLADGRDVAVKRLSGDFHQMEREFRAEVEALSRVRHRNLVALSGYCRLGKDVRLLIYPYMENGSLDHWLHERAGAGKDALPWPARLRIARGAARGLAHLHGGGGGGGARVMHRDVKSSNILLDAAMEARLGDFGLARLARGSDDTHVTTDLVGTLGYIPPEYGHSPAATYRGDVYSMVLVELVTGRRPVDMAARLGARDVTAWAVRLRREGRGHEAVDAAVSVSGRHREEAARVLELACACVSEDPKARPTAQQLVERLDAIAGAAPETRSGATEHRTVDN
ncbi:hypothetical protein ACQJBY_038901 [Aegilops geniculata]